MGRARFIDLIEHVAEWTRDAPLLLLIMARPELLDTRPGWGGGKLNATTVLLEPLPETDARNLLGHLIGPARLDDSAAARILEIAEGNPLFVEEIVAMLIDDGVLSSAEADGRSVAEPTAIAVPPTIQALIAARLDRLPPGERAVMEAASIEGKEFARQRLEALVDDGASEPVGIHLHALVRKDLIRPVGASEDTFRFRHQLIRDGAYERMPKELRADLHERFANQLDAGSSAVPVADELLGHHLERAVLLRRELGEAEEATAELAARASSAWAPPACGRPSATTRRQRARCSSGRPALVGPDDASARRAAAGARGVAVRGRPHHRGDRACSTRRSSARPRRGSRPARESSASSCASSPRRAPGPSTPVARRRRGAAGARARGRRRRAVPGLVPAGAGPVDRRARGRGRQRLG